jgi:hypothetical protein
LRAENENALDSMRFSRTSLSNEIDERNAQYEKHDEQRTSTPRGTMIDLTVELWNAFDSICFSRESFSNETDESDL